LERRIDLSDAQIDQIATSLSRMRTTCTTTCGSSDFNGWLGFGDCDGNSLGAFVGNVEAPCNLPPPGPWMDVNDILSVRFLLGSIATAACGASSEAGGGGVCASRCRELAP
jgi:hypothetical protein